MIYMTTYWYGSKQISIEIYGIEKEVFKHCENLGFSYPQLSITLIEFEHPITTDTRIN